MEPTAQKMAIDSELEKEFLIELMEKSTRGKILAVSCDGLITMILEGNDQDVSVLNSNMRSAWVQAIINFVKSSEKLSACSKACLDVFQGAA